MPVVPKKLSARIEALRLAKAQPWLNHLHFDDHGDCSLDIGFYSGPVLGSLAQVVIQSVRSPREIARFSALDLTAGYAGIEYRLPFLDQRLLHFMLYVPRRLIAWRGINRLIQRESLRNILPEAIRLRFGKCHFEGLVLRGLEKERQYIEELLRGSLSDRLGFLDSKLLRDAFQVYWRHPTREYWELLRPLYLEAWFREGTTHFS
ncbi:MAG: hypothetical protein H5T63_11090 [Chloroflexi bacterium]|nr:hypothetical protein [Chloroflexota bacterium]